MNWLDWLMIVLAALSVIEGFKRGFVRMGIGFAALILGFFAASWFGGLLTPTLMPYITSKPIASLVSFMIIFCGVIAVGAVVAELLARALKIVGLSIFDRMLGGGFGFVRAAIVFMIAGMIITVFAPRGLRTTLANSYFGPYVMGGAEVFSAMTPYEIRQGFERSYAELREAIQEFGNPKKKKLPVREE
jgi:membrane protein required for colicin V production